MRSIRCLAILLILVVGIAGSRYSYAKVTHISFFASPKVTTDIGTARHDVTINTKKKIVIVESFDVSNRQVAKLTASKGGYSLTRYVKDVAGKKSKDKVVFDSKGNQLSLTTGNENAFRNWTEQYGAELKNQWVPKNKPTTAKDIENCEDKCFWKAFFCELGSGFSGCWFCAIVCAASYAYCLSQCPDYGVGQDIPGEPTGTQCGLRHCGEKEKCCKGDFICVPRTGSCK